MSQSSESKMKQLNDILKKSITDDKINRSLHAINRERFRSRAFSVGV